tara:strand:- start:573 stop:1679 length:1107 start_codon:yes stop_codon:yes gene_type:complete
MKTKKIIIKTINQKYPIIIGKNIIDNLSSILDKNFIKFEKCLIIIDKNVPNKMISKIRRSLINKKVYYFIFNANEKNKSQKKINQILKILLDKNFSREDCLITVGGGITGDVGGFAASLFKRGLKFVNIPTTLLAQVDSSIGGKTGVNTKHGKNLIGSFYQPKIVVSDLNFLNSLKKREMICGYGEILKHSLISNKNFFFFLNKNLTNILEINSYYTQKAIHESCLIKKRIVEKDEKEKHLRKILNLGHTFAHAYEASLKYSKKLNHGEAVLLGIFSAVKFSYEINLLNLKEYNLISNHLKNSKLPSNINNYFSPKNINNILSFMTKDKKNNSDKINLILLKKIGNPIIDKTFSKNFIKNFLRQKLFN